MKLRTSFVSNSSSASFVLDTALISSGMLRKIYNHMEVAKEECQKNGWKLLGGEGNIFGWVDDGDRWEFKCDGKNRLAVFTSMDNFDMGAFFEFIGVPKEAILEEDDNGYRFMDWK